MFENMTYEKIMADMLSGVSSDVDKREGSIIYDAIAPCAFQLAQAYYSLDNFIDLVMPDTAVGVYLERIAAGYGIARNPAVQAVRKIVTTAPVAQGTRWGLKDTTYKITSMISTNVYAAICDQPGEIGNSYSGVLENIDSVRGVTATLTDIITKGAEEQSDEDLRNEVYSLVQAPSTSGNADNYIKWAFDNSEVGKVRVFPLKNGNGTVEILVVNKNLEVDQDGGTTLTAAVAQHIESVRPIGASVTVNSPIKKVIPVTANIVCDGDKSIEDIKIAFENSLISYLKDTVFEVYSISYAKIGSLLLSTPGVKDYNSLLVDGGTGNITIGEMEIPVGGIVTLTEVV